MLLFSLYAVHVFRVHSRRCTPLFSATIADLFGNRWVNLWPPESVAETIAPSGAYEGPLAEEGSEERVVSPSATSEISSTVFMGNFVLFAGLLTGIFLVHVGLASAVEAYWLTQVRWKK